MYVKLCEVCNKVCQFLECRARPESAEWYCEHCHKSYPVPSKAEPRTKGAA